MQVPAMTHRRRVAAYFDVENLWYDVPTGQLPDEFARTVDVVTTFGVPVQLTASGHVNLLAELVPTAERRRARLLRSHPGRDGADLRLLEEMEQVPASCEVVIVGSGDGAFAPTLRRHRRAGRRTVVLARPGALSRHLAATADQVCWHATTAPTRQLLGVPA